jgi:hypothetical protein
MARIGTSPSRGIGQNRRAAICLLSRLIRLTCPCPLRAESRRSSGTMQVDRKLTEVNLVPRRRRKLDLFVAPVRKARGGARGRRIPLDSVLEES